MLEPDSQSLFGDLDDIGIDVPTGGGGDDCLTGDHEDGTKEDFYPTPPSADEYPDINRVLESACKAAIIHVLSLSLSFF